jgi:hypothetical protein
MMSNSLKSFFDDIDDINININTINNTIRVLSASEIRDEFEENMDSMLYRKVYDDELFIVSDTPKPKIDGKDFTGEWRNTKRVFLRDLKPNKISIIPQSKYNELWNVLLEFHHGQDIHIADEIFKMPNKESRHKDKIYNKYIELLNTLFASKSSKEVDAEVQTLLNDVVKENSNNTVNVNKKTRIRRNAQSLKYDLLSIPMGESLSEFETHLRNAFKRYCVKQGRYCKKNGKYYDSKFTQKLWELHPEWFDDVYCEFRAEPEPSTKQYEVLATVAGESEDGRKNPIVEILHDEKERPMLIPARLLRSEIIKIMEEEKSKPKPKKKGLISRFRNWISRVVAVD